MAIFAANIQNTTQRCGPFLHADYPKRIFRFYLAFGYSNSIIGNPENYKICISAKFDFDASGFGVPGNVGKRFLQNPEKGKRCIWIDRYV